jgi:predicted O-methyltransferase YrrM
MKDIIFSPQMTTFDMVDLEEIVSAFWPVLSLEIGSWKGLSTSIIARYTNLLYCVDTWQGAQNEPAMAQEASKVDVFAQFKANMQALGLDNKVRPLVMTSDDAFQIVKDGELNFIFIDGDHSYEQVKQDLRWANKLTPLGVIAGHDYDAGHPGVMQAVDEVLGNKAVIGKKSSIWYAQLGAQL